MKTIVFNKKGSPRKLIYREIDKPEPNDHEVLVKVHSVSLNAADYRSMKMGIIPKSKVFGADISGTIETTGKNISLFKPGDEVLGDLANYGFGGLAEYVTAPEKALIKKPAQISFEEAAALPIAAITALQALRDMGKIQKGHKVLIIGSSGGVGTFAIQLARYFETEVTGVCSSGNVQQTLTLGADNVIDYTKENFLKGNERYDIILAINGNYPLLSCRRSLSAKGVYITVGGSLSQIFKSIAFGWMLSLGSKKIKFLTARSNSTDLQFLAGLLEKGFIKPVIAQRFTLDKSPEAMDYLSQGHSTGKIVINVL